MGIGSSKGAFYHDDFHEEAAPWMIHPKDEDSKDNNVIDPEVDPGGTKPLDNPVVPVTNIIVPPNKMGITDEDLDKAIDVGMAFSGAGMTTKAYEKVGSAAIKYKGEIFEGFNHGEAYRKLTDKFPGVEYTKVEPGFITSHERFVDRKEAFGIAERAEQLRETNPQRELFSEDIKSARRIALEEEHKTK